MPAALVFDLDGTLIDSAPDLYHALLRLLAEEAKPPISFADMTSMVGDGAATLVRRVFAHLGHVVGDELPDLVARYLAHYESAIAVHTQPYPGVRETLETLRRSGHRMGVCTNKADKPTLAVLEALDLSKFFDAVIGSDTAPAKKPDPRHVLAVLDRLSAQSTNSVMIGDGDNDLLAAYGARVPIIHARYGYGVSQIHHVAPVAVIDDFSAIPMVLARITGDRRPQ